MKQSDRLVTTHGFTLIETLITVLLFAVVIMITGRIFEISLPKTKTIAKSEASNIEGMIGLEMFRRDLEQAGFGLFTDVDSPPPAFDEVLDDAGKAPMPSGFNRFNDASAVPRAVITAELPAGTPSPFIENTDYLVLKGTNVALNATSQCWTSIRGFDAPKIWGVNDLQESRNDQVVVVSQTYKQGELQRRLIYDTGAPSAWAIPFKVDGSYSSPFVPNSSDKQYYYYGIDSVAQRAPFNRTDYVLKKIKSETPARCSPDAGVLYKRVMNQADGSMRDIPIVDCVADMQVVLGWNLGSDPTLNVVTTHTNAAPDDPDHITKSDDETPVVDFSSVDAKFIRSRLKLIKVYLLVQDGGKDLSYKNSNTAFVIGDFDKSNLTRTRNLMDPNLLNYRWKLYRLVVRPKNLS